MFSLCGDGAVDMHSHVLPCIDDGSGDVQTSLAMLYSLAKQGVTDVVATPHFYAYVEEPTRFLERRAASAEMLTNALLPSQMPTPRIYLGAEVTYFSGISVCREIDSLCIQGTNVLLVEMPFYRWSEAVVSEMCRLMVEHGVCVVIAHIERYFGLFTSRMINKLISYGAIAQVNAGAFSDAHLCRRVLKLVSDKHARVIGSDCHNTSDRRPNIEQAGEIISKKLGADVLEELWSGGRMLLNGAELLVGTSLQTAQNEKTT